MAWRVIKYCFDDLYDGGTMVFAVDESLGGDKPRSKPSTNKNRKHYFKYSQYLPTFLVLLKIYRGVGIFCVSAIILTKL